MKKTINIIGAFDRYNYGDLLFPIVIDEYLKKYKQDINRNYNIEFFGLITSDLTSVGGKKTRSIKELYKTNLPEESMVIVAGGEVLGAKGPSLYMDVSGSQFSYFIKKVIRRLLGDRFLVPLAKQKFGISTNYPFLIEEGFKNNVHIVYNAVGARYLLNVPKDDYNYILSQLNKASFVSVREEDSVKNLAKTKVNLFPDSATIISEFFPLYELEKKVSPSVKKFIEKNPNYICLQTNLKVYNQYKKDFINQVNKLAGESESVKTLLLPLGHAANHDDREALLDLQKNTQGSVELILDLTIYDTMYLIGKSMFFAGTSLHGNITAMSYCVPHIGLSNKRPKLNSYLATWDIKEQNHCIEVADLYKYYNNLVNIDKKLLIDKKEELVGLVHQNFELIFDLIKEKSS